MSVLIHSEYRVTSQADLTEWVSSEVQAVSHNYNMAWVSEWKIWVLNSHEEWKTRSKMWDMNSINEESRVDFRESPVL